MMKHIIQSLCAIMLFTLLVTSAFAMTENKTEVEQDLTELFADMIDKTIIEDLQSIIGNERLQIVMTYADNKTVNGTIITEDNIITTAQIGSISDPTLDIYLSAETYLAIRESPDQINALLTAYNDGDITKDAHGFGKTVKFGVAGAILKIVSWFS